MPSSAPIWARWTSRCASPTARCPAVSGCNRFTGTYTTNGQSLTINPGLASTMMACPEPQMAVEQAFLKLLPTVTTYTIDGDTLRMADASGEPVLVFEHVSGEQAVAGDWVVTALRTATAVSLARAGLGADAVVRTTAPRPGTAGCNQFNGGYTVAGEDLTFGPLATTRKACADPAVGQQETDYLAALAATATFSLDEPDAHPAGRRRHDHGHADARRPVGEQRPDHLSPGRRDHAESRTIRQLSETNSTCPISSTRAVDEALHEAQEAVDVGEVRRHADRDADRRDEQAVVGEQPLAQLEERHRLAATEPPAHLARRSRWWATSPAPGLQKHPVRSEMLTRLASSSTRRSSIGRPAGSRIPNVTVPPRAVVSCRAVELHEWSAVGVAQAGERIEQPGGQAHHTVVDRRRARCARCGPARSSPPAG